MTTCHYIIEGQDELFLFLFCDVCFYCFHFIDSVRFYCLFNHLYLCQSSRLLFLIHLSEYLYRHSSSHQHPHSITEILTARQQCCLSAEWVSDAAAATAATGGRQETWLTDGWMAPVVTASVACSCCIRTNCIVTKVTMTWRRDPGARHPCLSNLQWFPQ